MTESHAAVTQHSPSEERIATESQNSDHVKRCEELVEQYRRGENGKSDTILALHETLLDTPAIRGGDSIARALGVYLRVLDEIDRSNSNAHGRGPESASQTLSENPVGGSIGRRGASAQEEEVGGSDQLSSTTGSGEYEGRESPPAKRRKVDESQFPWLGKRETNVASLPAEIQETFKQIDNYSKDPKRVLEHILSTPGCPSFPPSQWLNLIQWKYVDLGKVLESAHTIELDPKQSHAIDDKVELSFRASKSTMSIKTGTEFSSAFTMLVKAVAFVFPQRWEEFAEYQNFIAEMFISFQPSFHLHIIQFDQAVRNKISTQRHIRLTDTSHFDALRSTFLTSHGVGPNPAESTSESRGTGKQRPADQRREPCHKWNRGNCLKSESECYYSHCCDKRGCRGSHRRNECTKAGGKA